LSTVTKVFVVLLVVFSIAFTSMTVSMVAQTADWKTTAEKYSEQARIADTNLRNLIASNAAEMAAARDTVNAHQARVGELEKSLQSARNESAQLTLDLARVAAEKASAEAMSRGLLAQLQVSETGRTEYQKQRDDLEKQNIDLQRRNIDLNDRVNEQTAAIAVLQEQRRHYEQQIHILKTDNEKLANEARRVTSGMKLEDPAGGALPGVVALAPVSVTPIRGQVTDVSGNLVTITVGSADGVRKDMVFVVYRGEQYVGDLKITLVDPNQSAGRMIQSTAAPQAGDQVTDALRFSGSRG
jgi:hypothetical protein